MPPKLRPTPAYSTNVEIYAEVDSAGLTPRTPHSRQVDAEEGRSRRVRPALPVNESISEDEDDGNLDEIDLLQTQSHPLLHSSTSDSFPLVARHGNDWSRPRWSANDKKDNWIWRLVKERVVKDRLPLGLIVGTAAAILLLFLVVMSIKRQDTLLDYIGVNTTAIAYESLDEESKKRFNSSTVIDYAAAGYTSYPLTTDQYIHECWKVVHDPRMQYFVPYWSTRPGAELDVLHQRPSSSPKTCNSTITYLLDGAVGLMGDLAHLALVASFAREQNRTLFVYDEYWNRGLWTDHFLPFSETQPGPEPGCAPPPLQELVACPRSARHWITSARLNYFHTGDDFKDMYEDSYKYTIERLKPIFVRSAESFSGSIWPSVANQKLIFRARSEFAQLVETDLNVMGREYLSAHIRRGDLQAMSWRYQKLLKVQVPTSEFVDAVWQTHSRLSNVSNPDALSSFPPVAYVASDSPSAASEFTDLFLSYNDSFAQKYGHKGLKPIVYQLRTSTDAELQSLASEREYVQADWPNGTEESRVRETRGVIVDWALLSGAWIPRESDEIASWENNVHIKPAAAICTLPSNLCKLAAVGLGWDRAFNLGDFEPGPDRRWIEIDNHGGIVPIWRAFQKFS
ncbi:hypothetical protein K439DRAFT_1629792 [Ramaria rubella]|nr:hypothetical protein K439DRAFT_1629792 [Ramaria rubella]